MNRLELMKFSFKKTHLFWSKNSWSDDRSFITTGINSSSKYNLPESKRIFRFTINSCPTRIQVFSRIRLNDVECNPSPFIVYLFPDRIQHRFPFSILSRYPSATRSPCSSSPKLPSARWIFNFRRRSPRSWKRFLVISFWCATWPDQISQRRRFIRSFRAERGFSMRLNSA